MFGTVGQLNAVIVVGVVKLVGWFESKMLRVGVALNLKGWFNCLKAIDGVGV